jgi:hypothetical protein
MGGKDLAGLAALGTLGYMLANKGKKGSDRDTDTGVDVMPSYAMSRPSQAGMKDTEFGDLAGAQDAANSRAVMDQFNANEGMNKPSRSSMAKVQKAVRTPYVKDTIAADSLKNAPSTDSDTDFAPSGIGSGKKAPVASPSFQDRMAMEYLAKKKAEKEKPTKTSSASRPNSYYDGDEMKRGGKVVKMAKGGVTRSSASTRADGIAQRGKTKGTMIMCGGGYAKGKR